MAGEAAAGHRQLGRADRHRAKRLLVARSLLPDLPGYHPAGLLELELQAHRTDALRLSVRAALSDDERGPYAQRRLQLVDYPAAVGSPLRDMAVFSSFSGRQFSGNPRADLCGNAAQESRSGLRMGDRSMGSSACLKAPGC